MVLGIERTRVLAWGFLGALLVHDLIIRFGLELCLGPAQGRSYLPFGDATEFKRLLEVIYRSAVVARAQAGLTSSSVQRAPSRAQFDRLAEILDRLFQVSLLLPRETAVGCTRSRCGTPALAKFPPRAA